MKPWKRRGKWWVSHYNYIDEVRDTMDLPQRVLIHDVTLRDGEQTSGVVLRKDDKLKIALKLEEVGVHRIEAGMPAVSAEDREAIKTIAKQVTNSKVYGFCRTRKVDLDLAIDCDVDGIIMEVASQTERLKLLRWSVEEAAENVATLVRYTKDHGLPITFFPYETTRADFENVRELVTSATEEKVDAIAVIDTTGAALPQAFAYLVRKVKEVAGVPIEVHCHNHLGLATANSLAAVSAGAEVIHTCVNGMGEGGGNTALDETVFDLLLLMGIDTGVKTEKLNDLSRLVEKLSGIEVGVVKPIVGDNPYRRETGTIFERLFKVPEISEDLELYNPKLVGRSWKYLLGKKSGKYSILFKLRELGIEASDEEVQVLLTKVKLLSEERRTTITDEDFREMVREVVGQ